MKTYSQGMRQRLGLARVLLGRPEVLVLDEPTNGLDPGEMREVRQLVRRVAEAGSTVLFSSHVLAEVEQICTHAVVMDKGKLVATGSVVRPHRQRPARSTSRSTTSPPRRAGARGAAVGAAGRRRGARARGHDGRRTPLRPRRPRWSRAGIAVETVTARRRLEDAFLGLVEGVLMLTLAVMRTELVKSLRRPRTYVAYGILVLIPIIMAVAINLNPPDARGEGRLLFLASQTGLLLPGFALRVTSAFMLVIVVALFGGDAIAGEASWGNLRYLLMRPVKRGRLVVSKFVVAVFCAWIAVVLVVATALIVGSIVFGTASIPSFPPFFPGPVVRRHPVPPPGLDRATSRGASPGSSRSRSWCRA